jgi:hypothetical protein
MPKRVLLGRQGLARSGIGKDPEPQHHVCTTKSPNTDSAYNSSARSITHPVEIVLEKNVN